MVGVTPADIDADTVPLAVVVRMALAEMARPGMVLSVFVVSSSRVIFEALFPAVIMRVSRRAIRAVAANTHSNVVRVRALVTALVVKISCDGTQFVLADVLSVRISSRTVVGIGHRAETKDRGER